MNVKKSVMRQWKALDKKFADLEEKLRNKAKKKPKPYYRRGRWE